MFLEEDKSIVTGEIDKFVLDKVSRVEITGKKTNLIKWVLKRVSDEKTFSHDFAMNAWVNPQQVYKPMMEGKFTEQECLDKMEQQILEYNSFVDELLNNPEKRTEDNKKKLKDMGDNLPFKMIGYEQMKNHIIKFCKVLNVDKSKAVFDTRALNPNPTFKKDPFDNIVRITGTSRNPDQYKGTHLENAKKPILEFDFAGYKDVIDFCTNNLVGKEFYMVVGGTFNRDGQGPFPALPPYRENYISDNKDTLIFDYARMVDTYNAPKNKKEESVQKDDDLPF